MVCWSLARFHQFAYVHMSLCAASKARTRHLKYVHHMLTICMPTPHQTCPTCVHHMLKMANSIIKGHFHTSMHIM